MVTRRAATCQFSADCITMHAAWCVPSDGQLAEDADIYQNLNQLMFGRQLLV
jgi:hypothetical protein